MATKKYLNKIILLLIASISILAIILLVLPNDNSNSNISTEENDIQTVQAISFESAKAQFNGIQADFYLVADEMNYQFYSDLDSPALGYNNQIPGPLIEVTQGETKTIAVLNNLNTDTTVHFHGIIPENGNDGVPGVTQEAVAPGETFIYEITFEDAGLFWYHSHVDGHEQVERGLQGPLLVRRDDSSNDGLNQLEEQILVVDDVLLQEDGSFYSFSAGRMHGRFGNIMLINGQNNPVINTDGNINRLRIVNTANARTFNLYIPDTTMTVIGDGIGITNSYQTEVLTLNPGERADILVSGDTDTNYPIYHATSRGLTPMGSLEFGSTTSSEPILPSYEFDEEVYSQLQAKSVDYDLELQAKSHRMHGLLWTLNGNYFPEQTETVSWEKDQMMKIKITNTQGQPHPMHFHGQKFFVLTRNDEASNDYGLKDTVMLSSFETVEIGFIPEEKGDWVFHCHILEHAEAGMLGILEII